MFFITLFPPTAFHFVVHRPSPRLGAKCPTDTTLPISRRLVHGDRIDFWPLTTRNEWRD